MSNGADLPDDVDALDESHRRDNERYCLVMTLLQTSSRYADHAKQHCAAEACYGAVRRKPEAMYSRDALFGKAASSHRFAGNCTGMRKKRTTCRTQ
jgi:hypothetical protein